MSHQSISKSTKKDHCELIKLWEASVRYSHDFLNEKDIEQYRFLIHDYYFDQMKLYHIANKDEILGFIGIQKQNIQLLFVAPQHVGNGIGSALIDFAIGKHKASAVDVNEQNIKALKFYLKVGFTVTERSARDAAGKPYPVLSMQLLPHRSILLL